MAEVNRSDLRSGAIAGGVAVFLFTTVHHILISDIWFSFPFMLVAGILCGILLAWNYQLFTDRPTLTGWAAFNGLFVILLLLLGAASLIVFEPVTTMAEVISGDGPPDELFGQAMPLTVAYTLAAAVLVTAVWGWGWRRLAATSVTSVALILLFGLNISTIGLVDIPGEAAHVVGRFFGLIGLLGFAYAGTFAVLERRSLFAG